MKYHKDGRKSALFNGHTTTNDDGFVGISYKNFKYDNTNSLLAKNQMKGYSYREYEHDELDVFEQNENLYEVVCGGMTRKLFMDLDGVKDINGIRTHISLAGVEHLCDTFVRFLQECYDVKGVITYVIQASIVEAQKNDTEFKSLHVIFNVYTNTHYEANLLITDFKELNTPNHF